MRPKPEPPLIGTAPPSLPECVYQQLREAILNGVFQPGEVLRQEELARSLGVSRSPLREALPRLEVEGVVMLHPRRGYSVVSLDPQEILEIFDLRMLIEGDAVETATRMRTAADVATLRAALDRMAEAETTPAGLARWFELNFAFHDALVVPSGLRHYRRVISSLRTIVEPYIRVEVMLTGDVADAEAEHQALFDAFAEGAAARTAELTRQHIRHSAERLLEGLRQRAAAVGSVREPVPAEAPGAATAPLSKPVRRPKLRDTVGTGPTATRPGRPRSGA
jgi:DNA-binding GntR family transcriptional regulator